VCGICGLVETAGPVDRDVLERMTGTLWHRGPDEEAYYLSEPDGYGPGVGFGFRRLSIIDVEGGHQPLTNEDGSVWTMLNGEIYNFAGLRAGLEAKGHVFSTNGDAETLVHLYEESGVDCTEPLNGMFAFAVWDTARRRLLLARDRLGKKPLYYIELGDGGLLFASELKALLQHPACPRELDRAALEHYLAFEYVPSPHAIFSGIRKLPPGHRLVWERGRVSVKPYWDFRFDATDARPESAVVEEFEERLREAVRLRLVSDVPLGAFLSGGIDSSSVVAYMCDLLPPEQVQTFSIGFTERSFDESEHALRVARHFGTHHHEETFTPGVLLDVLPEVTAGLDEPFADPSVLPTFLLSRFARETVTVALGGDGGDELLAGYPTFPAEAVARRYVVPRGLHERVVVPLAERLPVSTDDFSFDFKLKRFLRGATEPASTRHQLWLGAFTTAEQRALLVEPPTVDPLAGLRALYKGQTTGDWVEKLIYLYAKTYLPDDILAKVDRASMLTSLEVRAPFLDYTLVEFLARVPSSLKLRRFDTKHLLKRAMNGRLPPGIAGRKKKGFGIPVAQWLKTDLREPLLDALSPDRLRRQGLFQAREVERLIREHLAGTRDHRKQLWTLFVFQLWYEHYVETSPDRRDHAYRAVGPTVAK
jgi:asparagine synthase (glutamine-hydrolysing)